MANQASRSSGAACVACKTLSLLGGSCIRWNRLPLLGNEKTIHVFDPPTQIGGGTKIQPLLDREREIGYIVLMNEQAVQYSEQNETDEEVMVTQIAPAPMVERAFRLL